MTATHPLLPEPIYFGEPSCFGWLHGRSARGVPVLICGALGAEELSTHRFLRQVAQDLAAQGQPCLRFDLAGQGDSAPLDEDIDALPAWLASIHAAVRALRAATGAPRIAIIGLRLGATLAAQVAQARDDVAAFVAWVPVVSGRALLREWKLLGAGGLPSLTHPDGSLESGGFHLSGATCAALNRLSLTVPLVRPAARMLVIDRDDLPGAAPWSDALRAAGVALDTADLPGFAGLLAVPHLTVWPEAMRASAVEWLGRLAPAAAPSARPAPQSCSATFEIDGVSVTERPLVLTAGSFDEPPLFGLCAEAATAPARGAPRTAVLVLNTGAERHIGPHGQFVALSRRWAAAGALVLRLDAAGLGDSPVRPGGADHQVYPAQALDDVRRALAHLRRQPGVQRVVALGLCSGAFHAFEAAASGLLLDLAVAINPLVFFRPEREAFEAIDGTDHAVQQLSADAVRGLRDPARWRKLLRGEADVAFLLRLVGRRAALVGKRWMTTARRAVGVPRADDLAAKLQLAARRPGTPSLCFVFAEHDPGLALLRADAGPALRTLLRRGRLRVDTVADADHTFSRREARRRLQAVLDDVLAVQETAPEPAADRARSRAAARTDPGALRNPRLQLKL